MHICRTNPWAAATENLGIGRVLPVQFTGPIQALATRNRVTFGADEILARDSLIVITVVELQGFVESGALV